jgi:hypothetical protein
MTARRGPARWWVRVCTSGLEPSIRDRRRTEIEADLWEQGHALMTEGWSAAAITAIVWQRSLVGVVDDGLWRREQPRAARTAPSTSEGRTSMFGPEARSTLALPIGAVALVIAIAIAVSVIDGIQYDEHSQRFISTSTLTAMSSVLGVVGLASVVAGFLAMRARPAAGVVLVVGGVVVTCLMTYWYVVPPILGIVVSAYAVRRARRIADSRPAAADAR